MANDHGPAPELLTVAEAAKMLRVSISGVRRLQRQRSLPFIKVGGSVRIARGDLTAYVEKRRVRSLAP